MRRFRIKARRAALTLLPAAMLFSLATGPAQSQEPVAGTSTTSAQTAKKPSPSRVSSKVSLRVSKHVKSGRVVKVAGKVRPGGRRWVMLRANGRKVKTVRTQRNGKFRVRFRARKIGVYKVKAKVGRTKRAWGAVSPRRRLNVYRASHASWYGPGFYGNRTACGRTLGTGTLGVAHKSLPCGTKVTFRHGKRTVTVPVIDRGPYAAGRTWDLTGATKRKLGFGSTGTVLSTK